MTWEVLEGAVQEFKMNVIGTFRNDVMFRKITEAVQIENVGALGANEHSCSGKHGKGAMGNHHTALGRGTGCSNREGF